MTDQGGHHINENFKRKKSPAFEDVQQLFQDIRKGDRVALGRGITLIESEKEEHFPLASQLLSLCLPHSGNAFRLGITGVPGAGKSTFIEAFGKHLTEQGNKIAVLAIDPTSALHRGSILGDKTRMEELSADLNAFIRPSPSGGALGGVARKTRESMILCEAAGYTMILVETVGVGQSEIQVHSMVDMFLLILIAGGGDELQGIKRGIMEMTDLLIINKDDGGNNPLAQKAKAEYAAALHLFPPAESGWTPRVETCSALEKRNIELILQRIEEFRNLSLTNGYFQKNRTEQNLYWFRQSLEEQLYHDFFHHPVIEKKMPEIRNAIINSTLSPFEAARILLETFKKS
ncbi:MAG: methylmalonyl Co-A mutase-associated GTPase MeaB [Flavobacteriales bacterium]|nr:methylmalonyl Co-A mutase-associated GTPase MeaB [Flavobacteriales bacterium]